jgi:hypothetical protein
VRPGTVVAPYVFFSLATLFGLLIREIVKMRLRAAGRRPDGSAAGLCRLEQANRITSTAVLATLGALMAVGLVSAVL